MKLTDTLEGLGRPVAYHPGLARMTGSVNAAIFLGQLMYWWPRRSGDTVYKTAADWERETALTQREQESARRALKKLGIITEDYRRLQHQMHYTLEEDRLNEVWQEYTNPANSEPEKELANQQERASRTDNSACPESTKAQVGKQQKRNSSYIHRLPETTTETTTVHAATPPTPPDKKQLPQQKDEIAAEWERRLTEHTPFDAWKNIGMQRANAKRMAQATRRIMEAEGLHDHAEIIDTMLATYLEAKRTGKAEYWRDAPVTPAAVYARWDQLLEKIKNRHSAGANENVMREVIW